MAKGKLGSKRREKDRQHTGGVKKHTGQSSVPVSGAKPMDIDDKMSFSLDEIIKRERDSKKRSKGLKGKKNVLKGAPIKKTQEPRRRKDVKANVRQPKEAPNLQITVNTGNIRERPVFNQVLSSAEFSESQMASRGVAPGLRERVQPVSLDYQVRSDSRYHEPRNHSNYSPYSSSHPVSRKPDHNMYYNSGQRTDGDSRMRRY